MTLDGFAILKSVGSHADLFSDARDAADKAALSIVATQLKAKTFDLDRLQHACKALGTDTLALVLEHLPDAIPKALVGRIDPHQSKTDSSSAAWIRSHVIALATGAMKPEPKPQAPTKTKRGSAKGEKKAKPQDDFVVENFWATSVMAKSPRRSKAPGKSK